MNSVLKLLCTFFLWQKPTAMLCLEGHGYKTKLWVVGYSLLKRTTAKHCLEHQAEAQKDDRNAVREQLVLKNWKLFRHMDFLWIGHCIIVTWVLALDHSIKPGKTNWIGKDTAPTFKFNSCWSNNREIVFCCHVNFAETNIRFLCFQFVQHCFGDKSKTHHCASYSGNHLYIDKTTTVLSFPPL